MLDLLAQGVQRGAGAGGKAFEVVRDRGLVKEDGNDSGCGQGSALVVGGQLANPVRHLVLGQRSLAVTGEDAGDAEVRANHHGAVGALFLDDVATLKVAMHVDDDRLLHHQEV